LKTVVVGIVLAIALALAVPLSSASPCAWGLAAPSGAVTPRVWGRIVIPRIGLDTAFFNGQAAADTDHGPSHYPWTAMPGLGRTVAIAGHRVTHTHPFLRLGELRRNDLVIVRYGRRPSFSRRACYRVTGSAVVSPTDVAVTRDVGFERLVLTTCTPPHHATNRLVIAARRVWSCAG
jgi:sortase A